ncbi:MAG: hypothetical protein ABR600_13600 [Actinomycetota bacterium]
MSSDGTERSLKDSQRLRIREKAAQVLEPNERILVSALCQGGRPPSVTFWISLAVVGAILGVLLLVLPLVGVRALHAVPGLAGGVGGGVGAGLTARLSPKWWLAVTDRRLIYLKSKPFSGRPFRPGVLRELRRCRYAGERSGRIWRGVEYLDETGERRGLYFTRGWESERQAIAEILRRGGSARLSAGGGNPT